MEKRFYDLVGNYRPTNTKILVQFIEDISDGTFTNKTDWGLQIRNKVADPHNARWAKVYSAGPEVPDRIVAGQYVLIEQLGWTESFKIDEDKYWMTGYEKILATSEVEPTEIV